ncbi:unnamed protein product [Owenia fusiformis]|uniref:non-specific serine/threonine protein kinase n=1 Tax=Owenia fusiformis TaxID=6347 RepID=A0A8J1UXK3_OWEFU|nr:unnamed protein product [Owenia fusiformis]
MASDFEKLRVIGTGTFGRAWLVKSNKNKRKYVIKEIQVLGSSEKEREQSLTEVAALGRCKNINVIRYKNAFVQNGMLNIVMEFADSGDLQGRIDRQNGEHFEQHVILDWFIQLCFGLRYIHSMKILHRDLKTQNIFLTRHNIVKIGDFGIARILKETHGCANTTIGTPYYLSPEICQKQPYDSKSDMWALGCVLYQMTCLKPPFDAPGFGPLVVKIMDGRYAPIPQHYGAILEDLINVLLKQDPLKRPSAEEILFIPSLQATIDTYIARQRELFKKRSSARDGSPAVESSGGESEKENFHPQLKRLEILQLQRSPTRPRKLSLQTPKNVPVVDKRVVQSTDGNKPLPKPKTNEKVTGPQISLYKEVLSRQRKQNIRMKELMNDRPTSDQTDSSNPEDSDSTDPKKPLKSKRKNVSQEPKDFRRDIIESDKSCVDSKQRSSDSKAKILCPYKIAFVDSDHQSSEDEARKSQSEVKTSQSEARKSQSEDNTSRSEARKAQSEDRNSQRKWQSPNIEINTNAGKVDTKCGEYTGEEVDKLVGKRMSKIETNKKGGLGYKIKRKSIESKRPVKYGSPYPLYEDNPDRKECNENVKDDKGKRKYKRSEQAIHYALMVDDSDASGFSPNVGRNVKQQIVKRERMKQQQNVNQQNLFQENENQGIKLFKNIDKKEKQPISKPKRAWIQKSRNQSKPEALYENVGQHVNQEMRDCNQAQLDNEIQETHVDNVEKQKFECQNTESFGKSKQIPFKRQDSDSLFNISIVKGHGSTYKVFKEPSMKGTPYKELDNIQSDVDVPLNKCPRPSCARCTKDKYKVLSQANSEVKDQVELLSYKSIPTTPKQVHESQTHITESLKQPIEVPKHQFEHLKQHSDPSKQPVKKHPIQSNDRPIESSMSETTKAAIASPPKLQRKHFLQASPGYSTSAMQVAYDEDSIKLHDRYGLCEGTEMIQKPISAKTFTTKKSKYVDHVPFSIVDTTPRDASIATDVTTANAVKTANIDSCCLVNQERVAIVVTEAEENNLASNYSIATSAYTMATNDDVKATRSNEQSDAMATECHSNQTPASLDLPPLESVDDFMARFLSKEIPKEPNKPREDISTTMTDKSKLNIDEKDVFTMVSDIPHHKVSFSDDENVDGFLSRCLGNQASGKVIPSEVSSRSATKDDDSGILSNSNTSGSSSNQSHGNNNHSDQIKNHENRSDMNILNGHEAASNKGMSSSTPSIPELLERQPITFRKSSADIQKLKFGIKRSLEFETKPSKHIRRSSSPALPYDPESNIITKMKKMTRGFGISNIHSRRLSTDYRYEVKADNKEAKDYKALFGDALTKKYPTPIVGNPSFPKSQEDEQITKLQDLQQKTQQAKMLLQTMKRQTSLSSQKSESEREKQEIKLKQQEEILLNIAEILYETSSPNLTVSVAMETIKNCLETNLGTAQYLDLYSDVKVGLALNHPFCYIKAGIDTEALPYFPLVLQLFKLEKME